MYGISTWDCRHLSRALHQVLWAILMNTKCRENCVGLWTFKEEGKTEENFAGTGNWHKGWLHSAAHAQSLIKVDFESNGLMCLAEDIELKDRRFKFGKPQTDLMLLAETGLSYWSWYCPEVNPIQERLNANSFERWWLEERNLLFKVIIYFHPGLTIWLYHCTPGIDFGSVTNVLKWVMTYTQFQELLMRHIMWNRAISLCGQCSEAIVWSQTEISSEMRHGKQDTPVLESGKASVWTMVCNGDPKLLCMY